MSKEKREWSALREIYYSFVAILPLTMTPNERRKKASPSSVRRMAWNGNDVCFCFFLFVCYIRATCFWFLNDGIWILKAWQLPVFGCLLLAVIQYTAILNTWLEHSFEDRPAVGFISLTFVHIIWLLLFSMAVVSLCVCVFFLFVSMLTHHCSHLFCRQYNLLVIFSFLSYWYKERMLVSSIAWLCVWCVTILLNTFHYDSQASCFCSFNFANAPVKISSTASSRAIWCYRHKNMWL